jgi:lipopolysaccharide/colanic/teichoic acid biosynthesis glycosyltransferase/ABC-type Mn2+/Zn2+ transport system ATPase subunit
MPAWQQSVKRIFDVVFSAVAMLILLPIYLYVAVRVKLGSKGPIFYKQERIGYEGRPFMIYKFRTMYTDAESQGPQLSQVNDPRITPFGHVMRKYRLDELPQFWNIIKGDMSIVGPRPERRYYIDQIEKIAPYYCLVYKVKPGLLSWGPIKIGYSDTVEKMVERLRAEATKMSIASLGRTVHAKQTYLDRLKARAIKEPFVDIRLPKITLPEVEVDTEEVVLSVEAYDVAFDESILENVSFALKAGEKVAIVGANGTGKTTMLREIYKKAHPAFSFGENVEVGFLSQLHGEMLDESKTVYEEFESLGFEKKADIAAYLSEYCFEADTLTQKIGQLSGGEQNLLQLAKISVSKANLLLLDEPTSHLDTYSQIALEKAVSEYKGAVLMVSHDFYNIVNCADYVLFVEEKSLRPMRIRSFRKKIYENHFSKDYLELEQKKKELETRISACLKSKDFKTAKKLCEQLEEIIGKMR